jgi:hypothetical protein
MASRLLPLNQLLVPNPTEPFSVFMASPYSGREDKAQPDVYWEDSEFEP